MFSGARLPAVVLVNLSSYPQIGEANSDTSFIFDFLLACTASFIRNLANSRLPSSFGPFALGVMWHLPLKQFTDLQHNKQKITQLFKYHMMLF